ncbi:hypothetical protein LH51_16570 [Nitrincola sp. A-D6]|uniref:hypothetical protein n=1 Tax=Nitrincola sp. A-D6 TaxID=1545442 RepID=UPI00051FAB27|nr:hypothetical protein [Nitrincola sp. A-D6]KGK41213.1 hypothetical protein LH51_16570 [Nitrincola sp. A-D6]
MGKLWFRTKAVFLLITWPVLIYVLAAVEMCREVASEIRSEGGISGIYRKCWFMVKRGEYA